MENTSRSTPEKGEGEGESESGLRGTSDDQVVIASNVNITIETSQATQEELEKKKQLLETSNLLLKMKGDPASKNTSRRKSFIASLTSFVSAFLGIGLVAALHFWILQPLQLSLIIGSFGASAVLIYGELKSPLAQPRNFIGGHLVSALVGVTVRLVLSDHPYVASPLAVALAVSCMQFTRTTHPPGGATALIAVTSPPFPWYGYMYVLVPVLSGCASMLLVAIVINNISRRYPMYWL